MMNNKKGFTLIAIPLTIALIGLISGGLLLTSSYEKSQLSARDNQRSADMAAVQLLLTDYFSSNKGYPLQKNEAGYGWEELEQSLGELPNDPLAGSGWSYGYWSDGLAYTLRYLNEQTMEEQVIYSY